MKNNTEYDSLSKKLLELMAQAKKLEKSHKGKPSEDRIRLGDEIMEIAAKLKENLRDDSRW